ncbi:sugar ABC transporter substrate-binding protein [Lentibacter algarum]|uniref:sugar ABC transporter substrate-binding protein n=1 Tax=Lentibacter algarum TaxID=576131 RepID=UPI001C064BA2|nr:sugar ABC transporter substrate-binding protein [Lentibacter algarum]MBU2980196.1 sugar ABC transporter substrate-binding protein [Lentibacter algarum]
MKYSKFIKAVAVGMALITATGSLPGAAYAEGEKVAVFLKNISNPYWRAVRIGSEKAAKEYGLDITIVAPTKPDNIEEQTRQVEDWIVKKPDAFVFVPVDYKAMEPLVHKANEAGIPVINFSNRVENVDLVSYIGSDDFTIGYEAAKYLFDEIGGAGKVVYIEGVPAAITAQRRKAGFEKALSEYENIELLTSQTGMYRRLPALQVMENLLQRYPEIDAVMAANDDMAVGVVEALKTAGRLDGVPVMGVDVIPDAAQLIKDGKMFASADYSGHDQGYLAVVAAARHLRGEEVPANISLPVVIVNQGNVDPWLLEPEQKPTPDWDAVIAAQ